MKIEIHQGIIEGVLEVDAQIPEFDGRNTKEKLEQRLSNIPHLILIAAYKMGYELSNLEFYSWLGGVVPTARKKGIATQLRLAQESWAYEKGYKAISVSL